MTIVDYGRLKSIMEEWENIEKESLITYLDS